MIDDVVAKRCRHSWRNSCNTLCFPQKKGVQFRGWGCRRQGYLRVNIVTPTAIALHWSFNVLLISKILADKDENCRHHVIIWINHGFVCAVDICALVIARRGETTHTGVDVNNTHLSMKNSFNTPWFSSRSSVLIYICIYICTFLIRVLL